MKKGITLIALVITIVVLLILAGATIALTIGQDGIINRTKDSKLDARYASIMDKVKLRESDNSLANEYKEDGESREAFVKRLISEGLIIMPEDTYDDVNYNSISLGKQKDNTYKYIINISDGLYND